MTALSGGKQTNGWGCLTSGACEAPKGTLRKRAPGALTAKRCNQSPGPSRAKDTADDADPMQDYVVAGAMRSDRR